MSENLRESNITVLLRQFNFYNGTSYKSSYEPNRKVAGDAYDVANGDVLEIKTFLKSWAEMKKDEPKKSPIECFESFITLKTAKTEEKPTEEKAVVEAKPLEPTSVNTAMDVLSGAIVKLIGETKQKEIEQSVIAGAKEQIAEFIKSEYGTIERKITTVVDGKRAEVECLQHEKFEQIVKFVANDEPVFLTGPTGTGKNVLCQQVAKALDLDFYFSNAVTQEYKITGFTDAMGVFHESQFYKAFKNGGLFMLDEMDASIPEVLVILNAAIANRYFNFPAPIGYVKAHPNFRIISAGNTFGLGANYEYVGRNQLDMASLDRFAVVKIGYDRNIELNVANGNEELVNFADDFRKSAQTAGVRFIVSYRAIGRMAKLEQLLGVEETLKTCFLKSLEVDDISAILSGMTVENKYTKAVRKIKRELSV